MPNRFNQYWFQRTFETFLFSFQTKYLPKTYNIMCVGNICFYRDKLGNNIVRTYSILRIKQMHVCNIFRNTTEYYESLLFVAVFLDFKTK